MVPCHVSLDYPGLASEVLRLFRGLGLKLDLPQGQTCCGQAAYNGGFVKEAAEAARHTCGIFAGYERVLCIGGSCARFVNERRGELVGSPPSFTVEDALSAALSLGAKPGRGPNGPAALHFGCHGSRGDRFTKSCGDAVQSAMGAPPAQWEQPPCCGFGGLFSHRFPELSRRMGELTTKRAGAAIISTEPACAEHLRREGRDAHYLLELLTL